MTIASFNNILNSKDVWYPNSYTDYIDYHFRLFKNALQVPKDEHEKDLRFRI